MKAAHETSKKIVPTTAALWYLSGSVSRLAVPWQLPIRRIKAHSTAG